MNYDHLFIDSYNEILQYFCIHYWSKIKYVPIIVKDHYIDDFFSLELDYHDGMFIKGSITPRWERTCNICGLNQITFNNFKE